MVKKAGFRDGIEKEDIIKTLTEDDWRRIKLMKDIDNNTFKLPDAEYCAVRTDQMFQLFHQIMFDIDATTFNILSAQSKLEHNKVDILKGWTTRMYPGTDQKMTDRDLEIENVHIRRLVGENIRVLWNLFTNLYKYIGVHRLDKQIMFTEEEYQGKMDWAKEELRKNGVTFP